VLGCAHLRDRTKGYHVITFTGADRSLHRMQPWSPSAILAGVVVVAALVVAATTPQARESLLGLLGYATARGLMQPGLALHWLLETSVGLAVVNALYLLLIGCKLEADFGRAWAPALVWAGAVAALVGRLVLRPDALASVQVGASGAIAVAMGMAAVPYGLGSPRQAWGEARVGSSLPALPFVAVLGAWFVHQVLGLVSSGSAGTPQGWAYAAHLGELGFGAAVGLVLRRLLPPASRRGESERESRASEAQLARGLELVRKEPSRAVTELRRVLERDGARMEAILGVVDALARSGDRKACVEEGVARIALLLRHHRAREAAMVYERVREGVGGDTSVAPRLTAMLASALVDAWRRTGNVRAAEHLGHAWWAARGKDADAWRVREALAALESGIESRGGGTRGKR
jgi:hypothetical protein